METPVTGFLLERVYLNRLHFEGQPITEDLPAGGELQISVGWDWRFVKDKCFEVLLRIGIDPTKERPEKADALVVGRFHLSGETTSVALLSFAKIQAVAILFPYAREAISNLTSKGIIGSLEINPVNVIDMMKSFSQETTTAARQLGENPQLALEWGLAAPQLPAATPEVAK